MLPEVPEGWRMLAIYPMNSSGKPDGYVVCAEHAVLIGGPLVYVTARTYEPMRPEAWTDARVSVEPDEAMQRALNNAGWSNLGLQCRHCGHYATD
jgi:hypothetical protein